MTILTTPCNAKKKRVDKLLKCEKTRTKWLEGHGLGTAEYIKRKTDLIYARGFYYPDFFCDYFFKHLTYDPVLAQYIPSAKFHTELFEEQMKGWSLAIIARGHAKTTRGILRWIWKICYYDQIGHKDFLLWTSDKLLKEVIFKIRTEFVENDRLRRFYGVLVAEEKTDKASRLKRFTQTNIDFLNGCRIKGITKFGAVRGQRPDDIWVDDPQENKEVQNEEIALKFINHLKTSLIPTLTPHGVINITGTNLGKFCLVNLLSEDETNDFRLLEYQAVRNLEIGYQPVIKNGEEVAKRPFIKSGKPIWEDRFTLPVLEKLLRNMGEEEFLQEFQNVPMLLGQNPVFDRSLYYKIKKPTKVDGNWTYYCPLDEYGNPIPILNLIIGLDPCGDVSSGKDGDKLSINVYTRTGELVAEYHGRVDQGLAASELNDFFAMGFRGLIVIERNIGLHLIKACQEYELLKDSLYREQKPAQLGKREQTRVVGWYTSESSKLKMIGELKFLFRYTSMKQTDMDTSAYDPMNPIELEVSQATYDEMLVFCQNDKGKMEALAGHHDDRVMGLALAIQGRHTAYVPEELPDLEDIGL